MVLAVQFYDVVVWLHITAAILAFGPTFGYAFFQTIAERTNPRAIPTVMAAMTAIDRYMVTPGVIVLAAAGIYLTEHGRTQWDGPARLNVDRELARLS